MAWSDIKRRVDDCLLFVPARIKSTYVHVHRILRYKSSRVVLIRDDLRDLSFFLKSSCRTLHTRIYRRGTRAGSSSRAANHRGRLDPPAQDRGLDPVIEWKRKPAIDNRRCPATSRFTHVNSSGRDVGLAVSRMKAKGQAHYQSPASIKSTRSRHRVTTFRDLAFPDFPRPRPSSLDETEPRRGR